MAENESLVTKEDTTYAEIRNLIYTVRGKQIMLDSDVAMLSRLLKNDIAVQVSINIMNAFVEMRKYLM